MKHECHVTQGGGNVIHVVERGSCDGGTGSCDEMRGSYYGRRDLFHISQAI